MFDITIDAAFSLAQRVLQRKSQSKDRKDIVEINQYNFTLPQITVYCRPSAIDNDLFVSIPDILELFLKTFRTLPN